MFTIYNDNTLLLNMHAYTLYNNNNNKHTTTTTTKCIRWHQDGIWIGHMCKGIIQKRQESFSWGNPTEWQPSDTRPGPSWNIQVPGKGVGRRDPTSKNEGQDQEGV